MYDSLFFDLDGTLTDPGIGITNSVMYALKKFGIKVADRRELYRFIGPPLIDSFMNFYGFSESDAVLAVKYYREYFGEGGLFENEVYPGVPEMLAKLTEKGKKLYIATSKPDVYALKILEHFGLIGYFDSVYAATLDGKLSKKGDVIAVALADTIAVREKSLMIGDREHDMLGAAQNGIDALGVSYGYGSREELLGTGAKYIADSAAEILDFV